MKFFRKFFVTDHFNIIMISIKSFENLKILQKLTNIYILIRKTLPYLATFTKLYNTIEQQLSNLVKNLNFFKLKQEA